MFTGFASDCLDPSDYGSPARPMPPDCGWCGEVSAPGCVDVEGEPSCAMHAAGAPSCTRVVGPWRGFATLPRAERERLATLGGTTAQRARKAG